MPSTSGRSSRSTLIEMKRSFRNGRHLRRPRTTRAPSRGTSGRRRSRPTGRPAGRPPRAAAKASSPQGYHATGLCACCSRYGLVAPPRRFGRSSGIRPVWQRAVFRVGARRADDFPDGRCGRSSWWATGGRSASCRRGRRDPRSAVRGPFAPRSAPAAGMDPGGGRGGPARARSGPTRSSETVDPVPRRPGPGRRLRGRRDGPAMRSDGGRAALFPADRRQRADALRRAAAGEVVVPDGQLASDPGPASAAADRPPTPSSWPGSRTGSARCSRMIAEGVGHQRVARALGIAPATVQSHVKNLLAKLGVHTKVEAARVAWRVGIAGRARGRLSFRRAARPRSLRLWSAPRPESSSWADIPSSSGSFGSRSIAREALDVVGEVSTAAEVRGPRSTSPRARRGRAGSRAPRRGRTAPAHPDPRRRRALRRRGLRPRPTGPRSSGAAGRRRRLPAEARRPPRRRRRGGAGPRRASGSSTPRSTTRWSRVRPLRPADARSRARLAGTVTEREREILGAARRRADDAPGGAAPGDLAPDRREPRRASSTASSSVDRRVQAVAQGAALGLIDLE